MEDNLQVWQNLYDNAQLRVRNLRLLDEIGVALVEALQSLEADSDAIKAYNFHMFPHLLDLAQNAQRDHSQFAEQVMQDGFDHQALYRDIMSFSERVYLLRCLLVRTSGAHLEPKIHEQNQAIEGLLNQILQNTFPPNAADLFYGQPGLGEPMHPEMDDLLNGDVHENGNVTPSHNQGGSTYDNDPSYAVAPQAGPSNYA
ncbi:hypothetical protein NLI96_g10604 [Meripilus lineatus]|uniref:Uncharacterized protein n=1 Tax=Meripilus lineatus TaxID=2056292 RepID=A0AAD5Y9Y6_9APHY|nr:hypothetical protein NLI96_g10604 [Physisporinus lineatus]